MGVNMTGEGVSITGISNYFKQNIYLEVYTSQHLFHINILHYFMGA